MPLSDFEIQKITEIVAGKINGKLDAKQLRHVIDSVVDKLAEQPVNEEIEGATCETSHPKDETEAKTDGPVAPVASIESVESAAPTAPVEPGELDSFDDAERESAGLYQKIEKTDTKRIIIATFGKNRPGVVAAITNILAENNCSIEDISQTLMQEFFSMIMVVDISNCPTDFALLRDNLKGTESQLGMKVYIMHEDIFSYMHRI